MLDRLAAAVLAGSLALLLLALLGGRSDLLDIAALAEGPAALASIACGLWLIARTHSGTARLWLGLCCVPGVPVLVPQLGPAGGECPAGARLRIAWLNAQQPIAAGPIAAWIAHERPQIVGLAEVSSGSAELRSMLARRYPHQRSCLANGRCSTLLYAAAAPAAAESLAHGDPENRRTLSAVRMTFAPSDSFGAFDVTALHLSRVLPLGRQATELMEAEAAIRPGPHSVLIGDFNISPRMRRLRDFAARNGLRVVLLPGPTWPERIGAYRTPRLWQIDQLLLGRDWSVAAVRLSPDLGSDHRGYVADLCRAGGAST